MPAEVLDLVSDFLINPDPDFPRDSDPNLYRKVRSLQNLRYTCRQLYHHSFPRIHFLSFLYAECRQPSCDPLLRIDPNYFQHPTQIPERVLPFLRPPLPNRRIPALPSISQTDRVIMETDWENVYRNWKTGYNWKNRAIMFKRCDTWLQDLQEVIWEGRNWGRVANYLIPGYVDQNLDQNPVGIVVAAIVINAQAPIGVAVDLDGIDDAVQALDDVFMQDAQEEETQEGGHFETELEQFQWPL
jgi:hypothetical protein